MNAIKQLFSRRKIDRDLSEEIRAHLDEQIEEFVRAGMLFGVGPRDPLLLMLACSSITVAGLVAAYLPARRAARMDPMRALRAE